MKKEVEISPLFSGDYLMGAGMTRQEYKDLVKKKKSKYGNQKKECKSGHVHDSTAEARYCDTLLILKKAGVINDYQSQYVINIEITNELGIKHKICDHIVDFLVKYPGERYEFHEVKGAKTKEWKIKYQLTRAVRPMIAYKIIDAGEI